MEKISDWQCECWCLFVCFLMLTVVSKKSLIVSDVFAHPDG